MSSVKDENDDEKQSSHFAHNFMNRLRSPLHPIRSLSTDAHNVEPSQLEAGLAPSQVAFDGLAASEDVASNILTGHGADEDGDTKKVGSDKMDNHQVLAGKDSVGNLVEGDHDTDQHLSTKPSTWASKVLSWRHKSDAEQHPAQSNSVGHEDAEASDQYAEQPPQYTEEARNLVRTFTVGNTGATYSGAVLVEHNDESWDTSHPTGASSGSETPAVDRYVADLDYVPAPKKYKPSVFGALLNSRFTDLQTYSEQQYQNLANYGLAANHQLHSKHHRRHRSAEPSAPSSGTATPSKKPKWYETRDHNSSTANMLVHAGISSTGPGVPTTSDAMPRPKPQTRQSNLISTAVDILNKKGFAEGRARVNVSHHEDIVAEVADIIACRKYLTKLCDSLLRYGAPTHRLEEYLASSARSLSIDAEFMYIPGVMMCTFIDSSIHTNTVELVRKREGLDFGRLKDVFDVYKCVIHHKYTPEEAIFQLDNIAKRPDAYSVWFRVFVFGLASVVVGPFSFSSRPIDFGPIFVLGCALGFMQLKVVPRSYQFSNVFEVFACVLTAFIARGLGSIRGSDGSYIFCFSATAQSSIAMILPGFLVLNSALELQGRNIVSGSVRMVYAIIYVLFLAFGLLVGTTIFGLIKRDAVTEVTCHVPEWFSPAGHRWKLIYTQFIWAPLFACCLAIVYRAKWTQLPVMALIAVCGHQANFWISTQLSSNLQVANAVGAFIIGCLANLYSRLFHGLAAAAMLPAIYCQVPGGLAASGSLVAGIDSSNQIFGNSSSISIINNGTQGFVNAQQDPSSVYGGTIFNVGYGMVQVAIGISVGLYLSALVVYPFGKSRSGLFSF